VVGSSAENVFNIPDDIPENQKITLARARSRQMGDCFGVNRKSKIENHEYLVETARYLHTRNR